MTRHAYDPNLQMLVTLEAAPDRDRLNFHRWLAETGRYAEDLGPADSCRACNGRHEFRLACAIRLEALAVPEVPA